MTEKKRTRRQFLKIAGVAGVAVVVGGAALYELTKPPTQLNSTQVMSSQVVSSQVSSTTAGPVIIGGPIPLTGPDAWYGPLTTDSATLAIKQWNAKGGLNGRQFTYVSEDGECQLPEGLLATQKLVEVDHVDILCGGTCSAVALGTGDYLQQANKILVCDGASNPLVSEKSGVGGWTNMFTQYPRDDERMQIFASYLLNTRGYKTFSVISLDDPYARGVEGYLATAVKAAGGTILSSDFYTPGTTDFTSDITKIKGLAPDCFFVNVIGVSDGVLIFTQARQQGLNTIVPSDHWASGCCTVNSDGVKLAGAATMEGITEIEPFLTTPLAPETVTFTNMYSAAYPTQPLTGDSVLEYYAVYIACQAITQAGTTDTDTVRATMQSPDFTWDYLGYNVHFDSHNHAHLPLFIKKCTNGQIVAIQVVQPPPI